MADVQTDLAIIGGGPGGYVAAIRAAQLGMKVTLVEANHLGGICLNWGCIPTKALLRSAEVLHLMKHAADYGLSAKDISFDLTKIVERSRAVSKQLSGGVAHLLKKNKVAVIDGYGTLMGGGKIAVTKDGKPTDTVAAKHIIIATGARARALPGFEADGKLVWSYREALVPDMMPKTLIVVGSGAIGIEFASFYAELGAKVTVVEAVDRIMPAEDAEIAAFARKQFEKRGIVIHTGAKLQKLDKGKDSVTAHIELNGKVEQLTADRIIMAVGITPNTDKIGLEKTKIKTDRGHIIVDQYLKTDEPNVYAIGDCVGAPWLAHKASHEGIICVEKIAGLHPHPMKRELIPGCTYANPQVASVGLSEAAAKEKGHTVRVGKFPFMANGKAIALGEPEGMVKTVFDAKTGELLGAHMVGCEVTEMIQGYVIAKTMEGTEEDLMHTVFPHPTLSEMMHEATLAAYDRAVHF